MEPIQKRVSVRLRVGGFAWFVSDGLSCSMAGPLRNIFLNLRMMVVFHVNQMRTSVYDWLCIIKSDRQVGRYQWGVLPQSHTGNGTWQKSEGSPKQRPTV